MTNPTPHGQVPDALRLAEILEGDYCPDWFYEQGVDEVSAELRRLHTYCQELESQVILDCMTHVQKPAEIEHVAGDVSKNGAEVNMSTQQTAPVHSGLVATMLDALRHAQKVLNQNNLHMECGPVNAAILAAHAPASSAVLKAIRKANMQLVRTGDYAFMLVPYKVATAQAAESVGRDAARLDWLIEQRAYVVSDPDACPGYWLNFIHKETGKRWVQCDEHPTPRAAIDAAMAANGGNK